MAAWPPLPNPPPTHLRKKKGNVPEGSRKVYFGGGGFSDLPPWRGLQEPALFFPCFSCIFQMVGFAYHTAKLPCHLLEPLVNCRMFLAKLEMPAQTSAHPVTMLVPICENRRRTDRSILRSLEARFQAFEFGNKLVALGARFRNPPPPKFAGAPRPPPPPPKTNFHRPMVSTISTNGGWGKYDMTEMVNNAWRSDSALTVPILKFCAVLSFALGVLNCIYAIFCNSIQNRGKIVLFWGCFSAEFSFGEAVFCTLSQKCFIFAIFFCGIQFCKAVLGTLSQNFVFLLFFRLA